MMKPSSSSKLVLKSNQAMAADLGKTLGAKKGSKGKLPLSKKKSSIGSKGNSMISIDKPTLALAPSIEEIKQVPEITETPKSELILPTGYDITSPQPFD